MGAYVHACVYVQVCEGVGACMHAQASVMCLLTYNYACVHACECYVYLSVHIYVYTI